MGVPTHVIPAWAGLGASRGWQEECGADRRPCALPSMRHLRLPESEDFFIIREF